MIEYVINVINKKKNSKEELEEYIKTNTYSFKELEQAFEHIMLTKKVTSTEEQSFCFLTLYKCFKDKNQLPKYIDCKNGMAVKKITNIQDFITHNENSVYGFVPTLKEVYKTWPVQI
jgi:hypothetical protein